MGESVSFACGSGVLLRRCLADVKLDAVEQNRHREGEWVDRVLLEHTDLIDGVYEGGFKTWECSLDLLEYLAEQDTATFRRKRVIE
ncbi:Histidine protein methyltransferase 1, partial [Entophlyctis luteolus]